MGSEAAGRGVPQGPEGVRPGWAASLEVLVVAADSPARSAAMCLLARGDGVGLVCVVASLAGALEYVRRYRADVVVVDGDLAAAGADGPLAELCAMAHVLVLADDSASDTVVAVLRAGVTSYLARRQSTEGELVSAAVATARGRSYLSREAARAVAEALRDAGAASRRSPHPDGRPSG